MERLAVLSNLNQEKLNQEKLNQEKHPVAWFAIDLRFRGENPRDNKLPATRERGVSYDRSLV